MTNYKFQATYKSRDKYRYPLPQAHIAHASFDFSHGTT